jgi:hypothetical protein
LAMCKNSALILEAIRQSFFTKLATVAMFTLVPVHFWTATSLVIFYKLPSASKPRILPKNVWSVKPYSHKPFALLSVILSQVDRPWNKILWHICSFPPSITYKENSLYKTVLTRTLSKINKRNSVCERMLVDSW